tara:strand:- start:54 stop:806 length:753 start_codon:yes stop_codon:yes gene_type:complete
LPELLPPELSPTAAVGLIILSFFTSVLTSVASIGGGITLISVMAILLPPFIVLPVHGVVQLGSNGGRMWLMRKHIDKRITILFGLGALVGVAIATRIFVTLSTQTLQLLLGAFILFSVWTPTFKPSNLPDKAYPIVGMVATFCTMFVGAVGPFVASFLSLERLQRHGVVATLSACATIQHTLKIFAFGYLGFQFKDWLVVMGAMVVMGFAGTWVGNRVLDKVPDQLFQWLFRGVVTVLAIKLLWAGLTTS